MMLLVSEILRTPAAGKQRLPKLFAVTAKTVSFSTGGGTKVKANPQNGLEATAVRNWEAAHAVALTSEPEERFCMKLSMVLCTRVRLPVLSAAPICAIRL